MNRIFFGIAPIFAMTTAKPKMGERGSSFVPPAERSASQPTEAG